MALVFYVVFIRWLLLGYLFDNGMLDWYGSLIDALNQVAHVNLGTGPHPLEEYRQRSDIFLFHIILILLIIASVRYISRRRGCLLLFAINLALLIAVFSVTEVILNTDTMQKKFSSYQHSELNEKVKSLSRNQRNSYGFRDIERQKKKADGVFRIAVLGDSFIYGDGLADKADIWSHILERRFNEKYGNSIEVIHWGKNGWSTHRELQFLKNQGSEFEIDFLIIGLFGNDLHISGTSMPRRYFIWHKIVRQTPLFKNTARFLSDNINNALYSLPYFKNWGSIGWRKALYSEENLRAYERILLDLKKHLEAKGIDYLFVFTPTLDETYREGYKLLSKVFDRNSMPYLDLSPKVWETFGGYSVEQIRQELWANPGNSHPAKPLTTLYADTVFKYFQNQISLPKSTMYLSTNTNRMN